MELIEMRWMILLICGLAFMVCDTAEARWFGRNRGRSYSQSTPSIPAGHSTASAQGVANIMATCGRVGHWGGNPGYEGCGSGSTQAAAYGNCCFANSGMATVDVGYAQASNGMWYCCRRYR